VRALLRRHSVAYFVLSTPEPAGMDGLWHAQCLAHLPCLHHCRHWFTAQRSGQRAVASQAASGSYSPCPLQHLHARAHAAHARSRFAAC